MTGCGVRAGATTLYQAVASKSGRPDSIMVGTSGSAGERFAPETASRRNLPAACSVLAVGTCATIMSIWFPTSASTPGPPPLNGMWVMSRPAELISMAPIRWLEEPVPAEP